MPIVKYVAVHSTPQKNIDYIMNGDKNDKGLYCTSINCACDEKMAYNEMKQLFEIYYKGKKRFFDPELKPDDEHTKGDKKEAVRIHHYIQSFAPEEKITPKEANAYGVEWAKRCFGKNCKVIVSTHLDKNHIHNHFAVCPIKCDGTKIQANWNTLKKFRGISDQMAKEHGLHIIVNPRHGYHQGISQGEYFARKKSNSYKAQITNMIDRLVISDDINNIADLIDGLKNNGFDVTQKDGKDYLYIKAPHARKAYASMSLGDGYSFEDLQYRICNKGNEISDEAIQKFSGIQRDYAIYMRKLQVCVFTGADYSVSYYQLRKSADLLSYLSNNRITSSTEFENHTNELFDRYKNIKRELKIIKDEISVLEKVIDDNKLYDELSHKDNLTEKEKEQFKQVQYLLLHSRIPDHELPIREERLRELIQQAESLFEQASVAEHEYKEVQSLYKTFVEQMQNTAYDMIQKQIEDEMQNIQEMEREQHQEQTEEQQIRRNTYDREY